MRVHTPKHMNRVVALVAAALLVVAALAGAAPQRALAKGLEAGKEVGTETERTDVVEINSIADLFREIVLSRESDDAGGDFSNKKLVLTTDIDLTDTSTKDFNDAIIKELGSLTFGTIDHPFTGEFDGQGHTIIGLDYRRDLFVPKANTGLFAATDGAYIHDINFRDGYIGADYRGGYIVGYSKNTTIEGVHIINCTSSVTPANNAVSLVTNAGLAGGMVVGQCEGGVIYNCEVQGGRVVCSATAAISGLGGEGLYLGAIAGTTDYGTVIEYCRVTPYASTDKDGNATYSYTQVHNKYDIAVGAVAGQAVYAGGIAGGINNGTQIMDCFSTADCYCYTGTYVSVGAGNVSYVGGIAARANLGAEPKYKKNVIERVHYAGNLHSMQYNAVLVIPIIQYDVNLSGIVERTSGDDEIEVHDAYFNYSATKDLRSGRTIMAYGDHASGEDYGPADDHYTDRTWWEGRNFDFEGDAERSSTYMSGKKHVNKWTMDFVNDMPVHGVSVKATLDFPGAGSVTFGTSKLVPEVSDEQTTSDPYNFAVQGVLPSDTDLSLTEALSERESWKNVHDEANAGFRFMGWYKQENVKVNHIGEDHSYFAGITGSTDKKLGTDAELKLHNSGTGVWDDAAYKDNDLFVAYYQAQVLFHDVRGLQVNTKGEASTDTSDDWYDYQAKLPSVSEPAADRAANGVDKDATFLGWTTMPSAVGGGYAAVTSTELQAMKSAGAFYQGGEVIESPMDLYPVYATCGSNIITQFEGWDLNGATDQTLRDGVGTTSITKTDSGYVIAAKGAGENGAFPDGYHFRGWYHVVNGKEYKVSNDPEYTIPASLDLTQRQTYIARLEYRVEYYAYSKASGKFQYDKVQTEWVNYQWGFTQSHAKSIAPDNNKQFILHWSAGPKDDGECDDDSDAIVDGFQVTEPLKAYGHWKDNSSYNIVIRSDFPLAAALEHNGTGSVSGYTVKASVHSGYTFIAWAGQGGNVGWKEVNAGASWKTSGAHDAGLYIYEAHLAARVAFHDANGNKLSFGNRAYSKNGTTELDAGEKDYVERLLDEKVLLDADQAKAYTYPLDGKTDTGIVHVSAASPTADKVTVKTDDANTAYTFLGWIDHNAIDAGQMAQDEWDYVFDAGDNTTKYITSDAAKAKPYLVKATDTVSRSMDLYPVYMKTAFSATTNIKRAGVTASSGLNVPADPAGKMSDADKDGKRTVTLTADASTRLSADSDGLYELMSWTVERSDGATETITTAGDAAVSNDNTVLTYTLLPGYTYVFVANYQPFAVVYHTNTGKTKVTARNDGDALGDAPTSEFDIDAIDRAESSAGSAKMHLFVGWTATAPADTSREYALWRDGGDTGPALAQATTVVHSSMELWPVYRPTTVSVNSNIDSQLANPSAIRSLKRVGDDGSRAALSASASDVDGYQFVGWYKGYSSDADRGTKVTSSDTYTLSADEPFSTTVYTAVYERVYDVRYHGTDGKVLYTVKVKASDNRSFVQTVKDDKGNDVETMIDYEPYQEIANQLDKANAADGAATQEIFAAWQWISMDRALPYGWDEFKNKTITGDMDIYPVTYRFTAMDDAGGAATGDYTSKLSWQISGDPTAATDDAEGVHVGFKGLYRGMKLTVHMDKVSYEPPEVGTGIVGSAVEANASAVNGVKVGLYDSPSIGSGGTANKIDVETTGDTTKGFSAGDAVFTFDTAGELTISKEAPAEAAGSVVSFVVTECKDASGATADGARSITVSAELAANADGTAAVATVKVRAPFGYYKVEENTWAWRFTPSYTVQDRTTGTWAAGNVATVFTKGEVKVTNTVSNSKWGSGEARAQNIFEGASATAKGGDK